MSDDTSKPGTREITKMLADLDLFFEFSKDDDGDWSWSLAPILEPDGDPSDAVTVTLLLMGSWLVVFSLESIELQLSEEQLRHILLLNPQLPATKIGLVGNERSHMSLWIGQELLMEHANLERLRLALGAITFGVRELRRRLRETGTSTVQE